MIEAALRHVIAYQGILSKSPWPALDKHPLAKEGVQILPGFIGEMGLEVKGFLAQVEPWLRAGWKIPARRVALYPDGTAFSDTEYFERIDSISQYFGMRKIVATLAFNGARTPIYFGLSGKEGCSNSVPSLIKKLWKGIYPQNMKLGRSIRTGMVLKMLIQRVGITV